MKLAIVNNDNNYATLLQHIIIDNTDHTVIWVANDAQSALDNTLSQPVDLILMGLLPDFDDGSSLTQRIMKSSPCAILIVTSVAAQNQSSIFSAMASGALDIIQSDIQINTSSNKNFIDELNRKFSIVETLNKSKPDDYIPPPKTEPVSRIPLASAIVCIGSSTGGPGALATLIAGLPDDTQATYVIIQHVDKNFINGLAEWLNNTVSLPVSVAEAHVRPVPGHIYIAGGDDHLLLNNELEFEYTPDPVDYSYRPSIDIFFNSVCQHWHNPKVGVLLTGMGDDGAQGLLQLKRNGAFTIAQDEETCIVFGMPRAAIKLNAASIILPIENIAKRITRRLIQQTTDDIVDSSTQPQGDCHDG